ncbi:MAG: hypothetical protein Q7V62_02215, partial [Actinomycetota bacterium]|nr:hypothetical protein [Actinomycetota bacterium]
MIVAVDSLTDPVRLELTVGVPGAVVSTVQLTLAPMPKLPASSPWRTMKLWGPSSNPLRLTGLLAHAANEPPSTEHCS